jgi:hypothetical protein
MSEEMFFSSVIEVGIQTLYASIFSLANDRLLVMSTEDGFNLLTWIAKILCAG